MTVRLLHSADWQLGKTFANIPGDAAVLLREARLDAVRRLARIAAERRVDAVLVAGDAFDTNQVADATLHRALEAMEAYPGPWLLLPGNHDAYLAECVWTRLERMDRRANLHAFAKPEPLPLLDGRLVVLPAPLTARRTLDDLTAWMDAAPTPAATLRVGLAHGSVAERLPAAAEAPNPIAADRALRARLDYLALGDWHGTLEIAPRTWYAGTPEPDRFLQNEPGHALLVELDGPGLPPRVERMRTAGYDWRIAEVTLAGEAEASVTLERALAAFGEPARTLVALTLKGHVGLAGRAAVDALLERWRARLCHLEVDDAGLLVAPEPGDLADLAADGIVREVARRLSLRAVEGSGEDRALAELALRRLWGLVQRMPQA
jgi:DNA repair exonuclease SbcCD nuclease subunit